MKLDSDFMRQILLLIENNEDYLMSSLALKKALSVKGRAAERKFMGHIMLLADNNVIESVNSKYPFGFVFGVDGEYSIIEASYRLTARGYELIDVIKNDEIFEKVFNCFRTYYMEHCQDTTRPFDGILPLLEELKKRKIKMAIVSNKLQPAVEQLNNHFFKKHISSAVGESATVRRKPNPDAVIAAMNALGSRKDETIYVGDSEIDIETAKNAGIDCIVVLWGFRDECFLRSQYHNIHYIHSPKELLYLLDTSI